LHALNFSYYIGQRLTFKGKKTFSRLIIRIGIAGIAVSIAVMIGAVAILTGFQKEITNKVIGFGSHIQVRALDMNETYEANPINRYGSYVEALNKMPEIEQMHVYANKAAIIKTDEYNEGIVLKGVDSSYSWDFLATCVIKGRLPKLNTEFASKEILISKTIADKLLLDTGDKVRLYFIQEPVRARALTISGVFETGLEDYDRAFAIVDLRHIQKLNGWSDSLVHGHEITLKSFDDLQRITEDINGELPPQLYSYSAVQMKPQIFDWLKLLDTNVIIIIALMILVASINMITALLVLIIERTNMIGILKALGSSNAGIQKIFLYKAAYLIAQGLLIGNALGIGFCLYQAQTKLITLNAESYYLSFVPINIDWVAIAVINVGAFVICLLAMILPSLMVSRISPVKAIRFD
jgi:lipoprotein-releasing system permease protein